MEKLLTESQVAELLQVQVSTLRAWRARGTGPRFIKLGPEKNSPVRYARQAIEEWLEGGKR